MDEIPEMFYFCSREALKYKSFIESCHWRPILNHFNLQNHRNYYKYQISVTSRSEIKFKKSIDKLGK